MSHIEEKGIGSATVSAAAFMEFLGRHPKIQIRKVGGMTWYFDYGLSNLAIATECAGVYRVRKDLADGSQIQEA